MKDQTVYPVRKPSMSGYVIIALSITIIFCLVFFLLPIRRTAQVYQHSQADWLFLIFYFAALVYFLRERYYSYVTIDIEGGYLSCGYITIFKQDQCIKMPLSVIEFEYRLIPTRDGEKWRLTLRSKTHKIQFLESTREFDKERLDQIFNALDDYNHKR